MNAGLIAGGSASTGVGLRAGGSVTNQSGGIISGKYGITGGLTAVTVVNAGTIFGSGGEGIYPVAGGTISNRASGMIGGTTAIVTGLDGGPGGTSAAVSVINAGSNGGSVNLLAGYANRVALDPGGSFGATVNGGNPASGHVSTLELASGTASGTVSRIGSRYIDFAAIQEDAGAIWTLTCANSLAPHTTFTNGGDKMPEVA